MKFQKSLLATALLVVGFSAHAAVDAKANVTKYKIDGQDYLVVDEIVTGSSSNLKQGQWFAVDKDGQLKAAEAQKVTDANKIAAGMVEVTNVGSTTPGTTTPKENSKHDSNADNNDYWSYEQTTTTTTTPGSTAGFTLKGQLVNVDENGNTAPVHGDVYQLKPGEPTDTTQTTTSTVKKDIHVGNLTEVKDGNNSGGKAKYDFKLTQNNAQGTLATIKAQAEGNTSVAAVTGNGLAVLDVPKNGLVDLEKGTVTFEKTVGKTTTEKNIALTSYKDKDGKDVVKVGTGAAAQYYLAKPGASEKNSILEAYTGDTTKLTQTGYGLADKTSGGLKATSVNTGLVSNQNVKYGESVTTEDNLATFAVSTTTPNEALDISGTSYKIDAKNTTKTTSKDVVTGIIAVDKVTGEKTYGLQATNIVDDKVTDQTTVTAQGITTTGDVTANGVSLNRLNQRVNQVEETAYRGVAIALAAQQQIPNIGAGQTAAFGGVGHYEGESALAFGLATVLADGRTSVSGAFGVAGDGEIGGRVGVSYVFGGK